MNKIILQDEGFKPDVIPFQKALKKEGIYRDTGGKNSLYIVVERTHDENDVIGIDRSGYFFPVAREYKGTVIELETEIIIKFRPK